MRLIHAARLSRLGDASTGLEKQDGAAQRYSDAFGHEIVATAADTDVSGSTRPHDRPKLGPWLTDPALVSQYDGIVASHLDRLGRSVRHLSELHHWAEVNGKKLITVEPNIDWSSDVGKLIWGIMSWLAEQELKAITRRSAESQQLLRSNGYLVGKAPFGFKTVLVPGSGGTDNPEDDHKTLMPDPKLVPVIREMVDRALRGEPFSAICRWLDNEGIRTPSGSGIWATQTVGKILRNESLIGYRIDSRGRTVLKFEGIINIETRNKLIQRINDKAHRRFTTNTDTAMLTNIIYCLKCEQTMYRTKKVRGDIVHEYYRCTGTNRAPSKCKNMIPVADVEQWIDTYFTEHVGDIEREERVIIRGNNHQDEIDRFQRALRDLDLDDPDLVTKVETLKREREQLQSLPAEPDRVVMRPTGEMTRDFWRRLTAADRRAFMIEFDMKIKATRGSFELQIDGTVVARYDAP